MRGELHRIDGELVEELAAFADTGTQRLGEYLGRWAEVDRLAGENGWIERNDNMFGGDA